MTISYFVNYKEYNCIRSLSYWCFFVELVFLCDIKSAYLPNCKHVDKLA